MQCIRFSRTDCCVMLLIALSVATCLGQITVAQTVNAPVSVVEVSAQRFVVDRFADVASEARAIIAEVQKRDRIPGMAAACAVDGELVWAQGLGYANLEHQVPATPRTRFRVGSVSKMLTVAAVAQLVEAGKLDLDAPVQRYVPTFPEKDFPITTRQLAGHLAGIRHYKLFDRGDSMRFRDVVDALSIFQDDPLIHPPGTKRAYSSYGWNLISAVVQGAAEQPFLEYMQEHVFDPLGLDDTSADVRREIIPNRTAFYGRNLDDELINMPEISVSHKWAGGGMLSSVEDLVVYGSAFLPGSRFLKPETLDVLFTNQATSDGRQVDNGIGWVVEKDRHGRTMYHHGGSIQGARAYLLILPKERIVVSLATNYRHKVNLGLSQSLAIAEVFAD